nr:hypothetical protein [Tanacetum cinerariifolium]
NTPNITGSGPNWLFDIDALAKSMNCKPVVAGNRSNRSAGKARVETVPDKEYILLPLWTQDPLFSSSSKDSPSDGFKPSGEVEKKDAEDPWNEDNKVLSTEEPRVNQKNDANVNNTNNINIDMSIFEDSNKDVFGAEADLNNLESTFQVSSILTTSIYKDHPLKQVIGDPHSAPQTRRMTKSVTKHASTPIKTLKPLMKDENAKDVDVHLYRSRIRLLMNLTSLRPNIMFVVCACARFQVTPKVLHLHAVKRIFRYLKCQPNLGLWYPTNSPFDLQAYTDSDYASASLDRKSTTGSCQFLDSRLISWQCKKQTIVANSTTKADFGLLQRPQIRAKVDGKTIVITKSSMGRDLHFDDEDDITSVFNDEYDTPSHTKKVFVNMRRKGKDFLGIVTPLFPSMLASQTLEGEDEAVYKERGDIVERAATIVASLDAEHDSGTINRTQFKAIPIVPFPRGFGAGGRPRRQETIRDRPAQTRVFDLETTKNAQAKEIVNIKKIVKRLERKRQLRTPGMKLFKIGTSRKRSLGEEDASKQERNDFDDEGFVTDMNDVFKDVKGEAEQVISAAADEVSTGDAVNTAGTEVNTTSVPITTADADYELAERLQEEKRGELNVEEKSRLFVELMDKKKKCFARLRAEEQRRKPLTKAQKRRKIWDDLQQESTKKQKVDDDDKEKEDLKQCYTSSYQACTHCREGLENLCKVVKAKHGYKMLKEAYERVLWGDLKAMFEPHEEDEVWKNLQGQDILLWKLYDSCGVHLVRFQNMHIYMLVEKTYYLTPVTITEMLNKKLQPEYWNEMSKMKVIKEGSKKLELLKINDDSFVSDTPLETICNEFNRLSGMDDDLFTYEVEILGLASIQCDLKEEDDSNDGDLDKQWVTHEIDADMEYDPFDVEFAEWLALKFYNHKTMDRYTKNGLWIYWTRGDDEVKLTDEEFSDPNDENLIDKDEVAEIFRIETNIF